MDRQSTAQLVETNDCQIEQTIAFSFVCCPHCVSAAQYSCQCVQVGVVSRYHDALNICTHDRFVGFEVV